MDHRPGTSMLGADPYATPATPASTARDEFARLFDASIGPVYAFVARRSADRAGAEAATARTFERAVTSIRRDGAGSRATLGWLYRLAGHSAGPAAVDPVPRLARALGGDLGRALRKLDDEHRRLLVLRWFDGLEATDIRATLGLSDATLTAALESAVAALAPADPATAHAALDTALARFTETRRRDEREVPSPGFVGALRERLLDPPSTPALRPSTSPSVVLVPPRTERVPTAHAAPRPRSSPPEGVPGPRWTALIVVAVLVLAAASVRGSASTATIARLFDAEQTVIVRDGSMARLSSGDGLRAGDVVSVRPGGFASVVLGGADMWLDAGASIRLVAGSPEAVVVEQLQGRVRHRAMVTTESSYRVATGPLTWTIHDAVFDVSRATVGDGRDRIDVGVHRGAVRFAGPDLAATVVAGRAATAALRAGPPDFAIRDLARLEGPSHWLFTPSSASAP